MTYSVVNCRSAGLSCGDSIDNYSTSEDDCGLNLRHIKCKFTYLVRDQMKKKSAEMNYYGKPYSRNSSYASYAKIRQAHGDYHSEIDQVTISTHDKQVQSQDFQVHSATITEPVAENDSPEIQPKPTRSPSTSLAGEQTSVVTPVRSTNPPVRTAYMSCLTNWFKETWELCHKRKNGIIAFLILCVIVWMALVYGALLGAALCGNGDPPFPIAHFGPSRAKLLVF